MEKKIMSVLLGSFLILSLLPMGAAETTLRTEEGLLQDPDDIVVQNPYPDIVYLGEQNVNFTLDVSNFGEEGDPSIYNANLTIEEEENGPFDWTEPADNKNATIGPGETVEFNNFSFSVPDVTEPDTYLVTAILNYTDEDGEFHELEADDIEITINSLDDLVNIEIDELEVFVGEKNVDVNILVENKDEDYFLENGNVTITDDDNLVEEWEENKIAIGDIGIGEEKYLDFQFNVSGIAEPKIYEFTATLKFTFRNTTYEDEITETFEADVEKNLEIVGEPYQLTVGEDFQRMVVQITNRNPPEGNVNISNILLTISGLPDGVDFSREEGNTASYREEGKLGTLEPDETGEIYYRVDVESGTKLGTHEINYDLEGVREDEENIHIEEYGIFEIEIGSAPILEAIIEDGSVDQKATHISFEVTFQNTGNVDLYNIEVNLMTDDEYFLKAVDHYEYGESVTEPQIYLGDLEVEEEKTKEFEIGLHRNIQDGEHRLLFNWTGYYYDETDDNYRWIRVQWDYEEQAPRTAMKYEATEKPEDMDEIENWEEWNGPQIFLEIEMVEINFIGDSDEVIDLDGGITNEEINITITNEELVDFKDVEVQLMVGEDTPFFNPVDRNREYVGMQGPAQDILSEGTERFTFIVDINTDFVSERIEEGAHAYESTVMVTQAVNVDTNEQVSDLEVDATIDLSGYGAEITVDAEISDHNLQARETFTLEYTIRNVGDEVARNTTVSMQPELYDNDWQIIDGFIRALASSSEKYEFEDIDDEERETWLEERSKNTSHLEINLLGIEDGEGIVDLHMYIEGALSAPRPHIWNLYIGEINPGDEYTVNFEMVTSEHISIGQPYQEDIHLEWMDADGTMKERVYPTTINLGDLREEIEEPEEPAEIAGMDAVTFGVILIIIILVIALAVSLMTRKTDVEREEEDAFEKMEEEERIEEEPKENFESDEMEEPEEPLFEEEPSSEGDEPGEEDR